MYGVQSQEKQMAIFLVSLDDNRRIDQAIDLLQVFGVYREDIFFCPNGIPDESDRDLAYGQVFVFPGVRTTADDWPNAKEVIFLTEAPASPRKTDPLQLL
ncbi:hypothetical protein V6O07_20570, partial [Arthrospira platensis SPKY2]